MSIQVKKEGSPWGPRTPRGEPHIIHSGSKAEGDGEIRLEDIPEYEPKRDEEKGDGEIFVYDIPEHKPEKDEKKGDGEIHLYDIPEYRPKEEDDSDYSGIRINNNNPAVRGNGSRPWPIPRIREIDELVIPIMDNFPRIPMDGSENACPTGLPGVQRRPTLASPYTNEPAVREEVHENVHLRAVFGTRQSTPAMNDTPTVRGQNIENVRLRTTPRNQQPAASAQQATNGRRAVRGENPESARVIPEALQSNSFAHAKLGVRLLVILMLALGVMAFLRRDKDVCQLRSPTIGRQKYPLAPYSGFVEVQNHLLEAQSELQSVEEVGKCEVQDITLSLADFSHRLLEDRHLQKLTHMYDLRTAHMMKAAFSTNKLPSKRRCPGRIQDPRPTAKRLQESIDDSSKELAKMKSSIINAITQAFNGYHNFRQDNLHHQARSDQTGCLQGLRKALRELEPSQEILRRSMARVNGLIKSFDQFESQTAVSVVKEDGVRYFEVKSRGGKALEDAEKAFLEAIEEGAYAAKETKAYRDMWNSIDLDDDELVPVPARSLAYFGGALILALVFPWIHGNTTS